MTQDHDRSQADPEVTLDELEKRLEEADGAAAPEVAEEIARRLGDTLDRIDGADGDGSRAP